MPRLRQVRTKEEAEKVPEDQPVSVVIEPEEAPLKGSTDGTKDEVEGLEGSVRKVETEDPIGDAPEVDDLRKRLADLENAEKVAQAAIAEQRRLVEEANRRTREAEERAVRAEHTASSRGLDAVNNALAAAQAESDAALQEYTAAVERSDVKAQVDANRRMSIANARMVQFEDTKADLEDRAKRVQEEERSRPQRDRNTDPVESAIAGLPDAAKTWLRSHTEFLTDPRKNAQIQYLHHEAIANGHSQFSPKYFEWIEIQTGLRKPPEKTTEDEQEQPQERVTVSAPVSRDAPSMSTGRPMTQRVTLNPEQREAARMAGISDVEYAKNLIKFNEAKKAGLIQ